MNAVKHQVGDIEIGSRTVTKLAWSRGAEHVCRLPRKLTGSRAPPIYADARVSDVALQPALKQLLHRDVPGRAMSGLGSRRGMPTALLARQLNLQIRNTSSRRVRPIARRAATIKCAAPWHRSKNMRGRPLRSTAKTRSWRDGGYRVSGPLRCLITRIAATVPCSPRATQSS